MEGKQTEIRKITINSKEYPKRLGEAVRYAKRTLCNRKSAGRQCTHSSCGRGQNVQRLWKKAGSLLCKGTGRSTGSR